MIPKMKNYCVLMRFHKPIGIFLLLWPTLWALWIASNGTPNLHLFVVFTLGVILMRAAGCIINDYFDRHIDCNIKRTIDRPITSGRVTPRESLLLFASICLLAFLLVLTLNKFTILLSIPALLLASLYPLAKRYTHLAQLVLGISFSWGIPMVFAATQNHIPDLAWLLYCINTVWIIVYDTEYAMTDREDDLKVGVRSTAILFGRLDKIIIGFLQIFTVLLLIFLGYYLQLHLFYYLSLFACIGLFSYQQILIKNREPAHCFKAFLNNNWVGLILFLGLAVSLWN